MITARLSSGLRGLRSSTLYRNFSDKVENEIIIEKIQALDVDGAPREGANIALMRMNRPKARNALGKLMIQQMRDAIDEMPMDPTVRAVILTSDVERVFCAGADLKERRDMTQLEAGMFVSKLRNTFTALGALGIPVIGAIEGAALGGGLEIALACDIRVAGEKAIFGLPETSLAIIPGAGGTQRLPRLIGAARAKELMFTGRRVSASDALKYGIVNHSVSHGEALNKAIEIANEIAKNGPVGVRCAKTAVDVGMQGDLTTGMEVERACYAQTIPTKDRIEGLEAFREKRTPVYKGE